MNTRIKLSIVVTSFVVVLLFFVYLSNGIFIFFENDKPSTSVGTSNNGKLINGKRLPSAGNNFVTYSYLGSALGRSTVNSRVRDTVLQAYEAVYTKHPEKIFLYGETGWPGGGRFRPHKTHENGLSVDFMVPVLDANGNSVPLPTSVFNKFGYGIDFSDKGAYDKFRIDFPAMAEHIYELKLSAERNGLKIRRVIFAHELQPYLFDTRYGRIIRNSIVCSTRPSWIRHDEHYHVDFELAS